MAYMWETEEPDRCPNPACRRNWHGLPIEHVNDFWSACEGSWAYERKGTADVRDSIDR